MQQIAYILFFWILRLSELDLDKTYIYQDFNPYTGKKLLEQNPQIASSWFTDLQFAFADKGLNLTITNKGPVVEEIKTGFVRSFIFSSSTDKSKIKTLVYIAIEFNIPKLKVERILHKAGYTLKSLNINWDL